jgi:hypothetical protein
MDLVKIRCQHKSNPLVQTVATGLPAGLTGIPVRFDREPVVETKKRISGELDVFSNLN